jgi:hypothetical protein
MCDMENKKEFVEGIISSLKERLQDFEKIRHRIKVEEQYSIYFVNLINVK